MGDYTKKPLITKWSDDHNATGQDTGLTAAAIHHNLDHIFSGITLDSSIDIDQYITTGVVRVTNAVQGTLPKVQDVTGFLQVMDIDHFDDTSALKDTIRVRQIIYLDSLTNTTPYTRVGQGDSKDDTTSIEWTTWNTIGSNLNRVVLTESITDSSLTIPNTMYESTGNYTLTLPDPNDFELGTRIGVEQYAGTGLVVCAGLEQITSPDIDTAGENIGAIIYIFEVVSSGVEGSTAYEWHMDTLQNNDGVFAAIQAQIAEHELANQTNLYQQFTSGAIAAYTIPSDGYVKYTYTPTTGFTSGLLTISKGGTLVHTVSHANTPTDALCAVQAGSVIYYTCVPNSTAYPIQLVFSPDEHAMYLREDHLNSSWHNKNTLATTYPDGYFADSVHLEQASDTPASIASVLGLQQYTESLKHKMIHCVANYTAAQTLTILRECIPAFRYNVSGNYTLVLPGGDAMGTNILTAGATCTVENRGTGIITIQYTNTSNTSFEMTLEENEISYLEWDGTDWITVVVG